MWPARVALMCHLSYMFENQRSEIVYLVHNFVNSSLMCTGFGEIERKSSTLIAIKMGSLLVTLVSRQESLWHCLYSWVVRCRRKPLK